MATDLLVAGAVPMQTAAGARRAATPSASAGRSASRAASPSRSAVEVTTTVSMPSARQARTIRTAISPRLATSTRRTGVRAGAGGGAVTGLVIVRTDPEQHLVVLDHLGVAGADLDDLARRRCDDRVHQLHDLDDRQLLVALDGLPDGHERRLGGGRGDPDG